MSKIDNRKDLLLLLLYAQGYSGEDHESIQGRTRLMKLLYLLSRERKIESAIGLAKGYSFEAYHYGPFSKELFDDVEFLQNVGLIVITSKGIAGPVEEDEANKVIDAVSVGAEEDEFVVEESVYKLSDAGVKFVREKLIPSVSQANFQVFKDVKKQFGSVPLNSLLKYVYTKYPDSAKNTKLQYLLS
jgi:uncharacterized protein YwgA